MSNLRVTSSSSRSCVACSDGLDFPIPISMAFQPIVDVEAGRVFAYEALVRGTQGQPASEVFAHVNNQTLYAFDQLCRVRAIETASRLGLEKTGARLAINFIPGAVYSPAACIRLTLETAAALNFPTDLIIFEITEVEEVKDPQHIQNIVDEYRRMGFLIALDDFGAGHSNINLLSDLSADIIKLDMQLTRNLHRKPVAMAIVSKLVELASDLKMVLVAEGIETEDEYYALRACNVRLMQGYLFAKPAFEELPSFTIPPPANYLGKALQLIPRVSSSNRSTAFRLLP